MIGKALQLSAATALVASFTFSAQAEDRVVNVFNWSDYIDSSILKDFTKETGIKVVYDVYDSNEILETKLLAGGSGYDVVVPTGSFLERQIKAGVFQKLDKSKLPNIKNMWDMVTKRTDIFDPGSEYSINYMWGTVGIGYNVAKIKEALGTDKIDSWAAVFDPAQAAKLKDCGINFLDSPTDMIPVTLAYLGLNPDSHDPADIAKAEEALLKVRPFVRKFHSSEYINGLANGDICVAVGYSGDVFQARDRAEEAKAGVELAYAIPKEGTQMWFDQMAIPADAPHKEEAFEFLNYMMRPEVIAKSSNYVFYANGNKASQQFLDKAVLDDPAVYPDAATMDKLFVNTALDPKTQRVFTRTWTKIVTGQ
ncbi:MAG: polyamine ABC transporter substrate-binding protein [Mesorhizobium sp.]